MTAGRRTRLRPTRSGASVVAASLTLIALGSVSGYVELSLLGVVGLALFAVALVWPRVTSAITFERLDVPRLVGRGDVIAITLVASALRTSAPATIIDQLAGLSVPIALPEIHSHSPITVRYRIRAMRRGVHQLGPLLEERTDPLDMVTSTVRHDVIEEVLVHPVVHRLGLSDNGVQLRQTRARITRVSDDPLADFRSLREYVYGDDERLIHWPTVAKTGTLMVRDHFDVRRTTRAVLLETLDRTATEALFEETVEIAASIVCESISKNINVVARTRDSAAPGRPALVASRIEALELFSRVTRTVADHTVPAGRMATRREQSDIIFLVAGAASPLIARMAGASAIARRLVVVRLIDGSAPAPRLPVRCLDVSSAVEFVQRWNLGRLA